LPTMRRKFAESGHPDWMARSKCGRATSCGHICRNLVTARQNNPLWKFPSVGWSCGRCCGQYFRRFSHFVGKKLAFLLKTKNYVIFPPIQISAIW
jgi:hypothetical protein